MRDSLERVYLLFVLIFPARFLSHTHKHTHIHAALPLLGAPSSFVQYRSGEETLSFYMEAMRKERKKSERKTKHRSNVAFGNAQFAHIEQRRSLLYAVRWLLCLSTT